MPPAEGSAAPKPPKAKGPQRKFPKGKYRVLRRTVLRASVGRDADAVATVRGGDIIDVSRGMKDREGLVWAKSSLGWVPPRHDGKRVLERVPKSAKRAPLGPEEAATDALLATSEAAAEEGGGQWGGGGGAQKKKKRPKRKGPAKRKTAAERQPKRPASPATPEEAASPDTLDVVCPEGMGAGDSLHIQTPAGDEIEIAIPEGVLPGEEFEISLADAAEQSQPPQGDDDDDEEEEEQDTMVVTCPDGMSAGDTIVIEVGDGEMEIEIPEGCVAGDEFEIEIADASPEPRAEEATEEPVPMGWRAQIGRHDWEVLEDTTGEGVLMQRVGGSIKKRFDRAEVWLALREAGQDNEPAQQEARLVAAEAEFKAQQQAQAESKREQTTALFLPHCSTVQPLTDVAPSLFSLLSWDRRSFLRGSRIQTCAARRSWGA